MASISSASSYLFTQAGIYYFRMAVPSELRELFGRRELRYSLKTESMKTAKSYSRTMAVMILKISIGQV